MKTFQYDRNALPVACNEDNAAINDRPDADVIAASSIGSELDDTECQVLARAMVAHVLTDGEILVAEGDNNNALFLLASGKLAVTSPRETQEIKLYIMKAGECAGTRAFVDRTPRTATLRAAGDTVVYAIEPDAFEALLKTSPGVVYKVMRALFRITHTNLMRMNDESRQMSNYIRKINGRY